MNLTHVEKALGSLVDEQQEAIVVSAHHPLSRHKQLMAALWKARRSRSEQAMVTHRVGTGGEWLSVFWGGGGFGVVVFGGVCHVGAVLFSRPSHATLTQLNTQSSPTTNYQARHHRL